MASLSAGTVSLPVKPDTRGFGAILGKEILGATSEVGKVASAAFAKTFGATTAVKLKEQNKVILASAADVERASMRVKTAQEAEALSAGRLRIADAQLAEARVKYAEGDSHLLKAEERLAVAQKTHAANSAAVEAATTRLVPVQGRLTTEQEKLGKMTERSHTALGRLGTGFRTVGSGIAKMAGPLAIAGGIATALGVEAVKAAANFESATTRLVTDAGESSKNLGKVREGLLNISHQTGLSADDVAKGMYIVSSAGYTYANKGLTVMKAVAEGAKAGFADVSTVGDALTTTMTDFGKAAGPPADAMSKLIATVSTGKTTMEALAGSLHSVLPQAAAAKLSLSEVLGAVGTMTAEGISAEQATQNLSHAIGSLQSPSMVSTKAMAGIGVSALDVAKNLGKRGLAGTYDVLFAAMAKHSHAGLVVVNTFAQSAQAATALKTQYAALPHSIQAIAAQYEKGQIPQKVYTKTLSEMDAHTRNLGMQFGTTVKRSQGFSDALKSGEGPTRTAAGQLEKMVGGATGLNVALHLTGDHMSTFVKNTKSIGKATSEAGGHVKGFAESQKTLKSQLDKLGSAWEVAGIKIGTKLIPVVIKAIPKLVKIADAIAEWAPAIGQAVGAIGDLIGKFEHGAKQWEDAVRIERKGLDALVGGFQHGGKQIGDAWNATVKSWKHGADQWDDAERNVKKGIRDLRAKFALGGKQIGDAWNGTVKNFQHGADQIGSATSDMTKKFGHGADQIKTFFAGVVKNFQHGADQIGTFFGKIVSGAATAWKNVIGAFDHGKQQIIGFFSGAATWLYNAGRHIIDGLVNGVSSMVGGLVNTVTGVAGKAITAAKKAFGIRSPSTVFHTIGTNIAQGLVNGLLGSKTQVVSASNQLANIVLGMFAQKKGGIGRATESSALHLLNTDTKKLIALSNRRAGILARISTEKAVLSAAQSTRTSDISNVESATTGLFNVTNYTSGTAMVAGLKQIITSTKKFKDTLARLVKAGIDPVTYRQIVEAGVGGGGLVAAELLLQQPKTIKQIASLQGQLGAQATSLGTTTANHLYSAGVSSAQGLLKGLQSQSSALTKQMERLATSMVHALKKKLGIRSPSTVFAEHGRNIAAGLSNGIKAGTKDVHDAIRKMTDHPVAVSSTLRMSQPPTPGGTAAPVVYMPDTITVRDAHGFEMRMQVVAEKTYKTQGQYATARTAGGTR